MHPAYCVSQRQCQYFNLSNQSAELHYSQLLIIRTPYRAGGSHMFLNVTRVLSLLSQPPLVMAVGLFQMIYIRTSNINMVDHSPAPQAGNRRRLLTTKPSADCGSSCSYSRQPRPGANVLKPMFLCQSSQELTVAPCKLSPVYD